MFEFKRMIPYLFAIAISFYLLPLFGRSTGDFMLIMLVVIPQACFVISCFYGFKNGWNLLFPIIVGMLFIPAIFIHFNSSAWVYIIGYALIALGGVFLGQSYKK